MSHWTIAAVWYATGLCGTAGILWALLFPSVHLPWRWQVVWAHLPHLFGFALFGPFAVPAVLVAALWTVYNGTQRILRLWESLRHGRDLSPLHRHRRH